MDRKIGDLTGRIRAQELARIRTAARRATALHPGPMGELLARELRAFADFGHRFGPDALIERLAAEVLAAEVLVAAPPDSATDVVLERASGS